MPSARVERRARLRDWPYAEEAKREREKERKRSDALLFVGVVVVVKSTRVKIFRCEKKQREREKRREKTEESELRGRFALSPFDFHKRTAQRSFPPFLPRSRIPGEQREREQQRASECPQHRRLRRRSSPSPPPSKFNPLLQQIPPPLE